MPASGQRGVALLEVLIAIAVLGVAGGAIGGLIRQAMVAERHARTEERTLASAERVLIAMSLLGRSELDQRIGRHPVGEFSVEVQRPRPTLYRIAVAPVEPPDVPLLVTVVHRARARRRAGRRADGPTGGRTDGSRVVPSSRRPVRPPSRRGFTLVEVIAAMTLLALLVVLVHRVVTVTTTGARAVRTARLDLDREANGRRWLRSVLRSLEAGGEGGDFDGRHDRLTFTSWLATARGWPERQRIVLAVAEGRFEARVASAPPLVLREDVTSLALDYLLEPGANTHWVRTWISPVSAPVAVRMRIGVVSSGEASVDTLLFLVGERG